jgi:hypothetical protein
MKKNTSHIYEKFIQEIWKNQNFNKEITTSDGQVVKIYDPGIENKELGGPDFRDSKVKIGNIVYYGDIEIDTFFTDWKSHGHHLNKRFNKVILHITFKGNTENPYVFTEEGRKIQSIPITSFLDQSLRTHIQDAINSERKARQGKMTCIDVNQLVDEKEKLDFICELGIERFKHKCERVLQRLKEIIYEKELGAKEPLIRYDTDEAFNNRVFHPTDFSDHEIWERIVYEGIFEALGYSKNKEQMLKLAKTVDLSFLKKFSKNEDFKIYLESAFFVTAGFLQIKFRFDEAESLEYIRKLKEVWNEIKHDFDKQFLSETIWNYHKLRPQNFPTIRIAGGIRIVHRIINDNLIGRIISDIKNINDLQNLTSALRNLLIVTGEGYWKHHYTIEDKTSVPINYFVGLARVDELMINVIFPIFSVYFELFNKKELAKKVQRLYLNYIQTSDNTLVTEVADGLELNDAWRRSVLYQGMIELFRTYCSREKCLECKIGKLAFG